MSATVHHAAACPQCGRRYLPPRPYCSACFLVATTPSEPRGAATVLSYSMLLRAGPAALVQTPTMILLLREDGDGASFMAPLEGISDGLRIGDVVTLATRVWPTGSGSTFSGVVARRTSLG